MKEFLEGLERWRREGEQVGLATLVRVAGVSPARAGARMGLTRGGKMVGSVSAGCVESDLLERAMSVLDGGRPALASYGVADEAGLGVGLSCGGTIDVLIEPYGPDDCWCAVRRRVDTRQPVALATALEPSTLRGRKLVVDREGIAAGAIDPTFDAGLAERAQRLIVEEGTRIFEFGERDGRVVVFAEAIPPARRLIIVGATQTGVELCRMARSFGYRVTVVDARQPFATRERFPDADRVLCAWPGEALDGEPLDAYTYVAVLSHDPKYDLPTLSIALRSEARYVGAIGSRETHRAREARLANQGFTASERARIRSPIGLDLGGRDPAEIALSILAEMQAVRYDRPATPLLGGAGPIHQGT
jgi:xanthine dehydrogenase accessory factor